LNPREILTCDVHGKWQLLFPLNFQLKWKDVWKKQRARKEIGFIGPCGIKPLLLIHGKPR
jgi:hypothetical protein